MVHMDTRGATGPQPCGILADRRRTNLDAHNIANGEPLIGKDHGFVRLIRGWHPGEWRTRTGYRLEAGQGQARRAWTLVPSA